MDRLPKTRRTHKKSRGGCAECKRRKLKCDEARPLCSGCVKREIKCWYPALAMSRLDINESNSSLRPLQMKPGASSTTNTDSTSPEPPQSSTETTPPTPFRNSQEDPIHSKAIGVFDIEDMNLWHHFIKHTASTLSTPFEEDLPAAALKCSYLMHGILAISALHLAYLEPSSQIQGKYKYLAQQHQDLALGPFQAEMKIISSTNAPNLFAFSILLVCFIFGSYRDPEYLFPFCSGALYHGLSNWMVCVRGCSMIVHLAGKYIIDKPIGLLIKKGQVTNSALYSGALPRPDEESSLLQIKNVVLNLPQIVNHTSKIEMEAYVDAIEHLRNGFASISSENTDILANKAACGVWPSMVSETFVRLLSQRTVPALIIMAHFCLIVERAKGCWYMDLRGLNLYLVVMQSLGEEWGQYVELPRSVFMGNKGKGIPG